MPPVVELHEGDCREVLATLDADSFDSVVTDSPYELGFMGKKWDSTGVAFDPATWSAALRVLKPGGYMLAMGGTRTYHRLACAVEDAGFEVRDCLMWMYGTGFPKGQGCLKPAWEPILLARKPGKRVLPLGIDVCRVPTDEAGKPREYEPREDRENWRITGGTNGSGATSPLGRYPANVLHDGSDEVLEAFAAFGESSSKATARNTAKNGTAAYGDFRGTGRVVGHDDTGTAARFFYCAKASKTERGEGNTHPTVKPLALMRWMVRLVTPEGGRVLDPFAGSGSTLIAAHAEGRSAVGVELDAKHCDIIAARFAAAVA
jgi:site-specific DNA-methyltransferase (adenine-specific)